MFMVLDALKALDKLGFIHCKWL